MNSSDTKLAGLSIVLPCYNQGAVLASTILIIRQALEALDFPYEIIAVNDGSSDDTNAILERQSQMGVRVYTHAKNLGKGSAVQTGVFAARHPVTLFLDADLAISIEEVKNFLKVLEAEPTIDIAVASRFVKGSTILVPVLWYRKPLEWIFRMLRKAIIGVRSIEDTQCGFKMLRTEVAKKLFMNISCRRFGFDAELLFIARVWGIGIRELPIALQNPPKSSIRIGRDSAEMFFDLLKIRWKQARGWYRYEEEKSTVNITLDDFGKNNLINQRITSIITDPRIARVSIMIEGVLPQDTASVLLESKKKIDLHLELPHSRNESVIHGTFFSRIVKFFGAVLGGELQPTKVEASWRMQIQEFQNLFGKLPDGLNSHEHVHFYPPFYAVILKLAREYQIPFVRIGRQPTFCAHLVTWALDCLRFINQHCIGQPQDTSSRLFSFDWGTMHPKYVRDAQSEILYHVERDEEWVHLEA